MMLTVMVLLVEVSKAWRAPPLSVQYPSVRYLARSSTDPVGAGAATGGAVMVPVGASCAKLGRAGNSRKMRVRVLKMCIICRRLK